MQEVSAFCYGQEGLANWLYINVESIVSDFISLWTKHNVHTNAQIVAQWLCTLMHFVIQCIIKLQYMVKGQSLPIRVHFDKKFPPGNTLRMFGY